MIKAFIISIVGFLEFYLGPIYGPITGAELNIITGKVEELTEKINALEHRLDQDRRLEEEMALSKLGAFKKIVVSAIVIGSILFLFHSFGGDLPGVVGDIGNSLGNQVSNVGNILNKDIFQGVNTTNKLISSDHQTILERLTNLEGNVMSAVNSMSKQIARLADPRMSKSSFFNNLRSQDGS